MDWIRARLQEASTYRGVSWLLLAAGLPVVPVDQLQLIGTGVLALVGAIDTLKQG